MKILKVNAHYFDVFVGDGWENWSRWHRSDKGFLKQVAGEEVNKFVKISVIKQLAK